jgi:S-adenosylmethionine decarboxylase
MNETAEARLTALPLGNQLVVDFYDCGCGSFDDLEWVENVMIEAANRARATVIDVVFHKFNPYGISGLVVIAESHFAIHTWPEHRYAAIDIFTCGDTLDSEAAVAYLATQFRCLKRSVTKLPRGKPSELANGLHALNERAAAPDRFFAVGNIGYKKFPIEY